MDTNDYRVISRSDGCFEYYFVGTPDGDEELLLTTTNVSLETLTRVASQHSNGVR